MASFTVIGIILFTIPFTIIALHSTVKYLNDKQNSQKKHVCYAFVCVSVGFILDLIGGLLASPDMSPERHMIVNILFKLFDAFNIIGVFWLFIFLKDFIRPMKRYIIPALAHMMISLIVIFVTPASVIFLEAGFVVDRTGIRSVAILFFWFLYWSIIAYHFWKHSKLMTKKVAVRRSQMMSAGGVFAVLAYVGVILAKVYHSTILEFAGEFFAIAAGIVFYAGFVAPERLRRMWGE